MESFSSQGKRVDSNVLRFHAPSTLLQGAEVVPSVDKVPHEVAMLRRPARMEAAAVPLREREDGSVEKAHRLTTALATLSESLAEPGVLTGSHVHYADDLRILADSLGALVNEVVESRAGSGLPVFAREPLRPRPAVPGPRVAATAIAGLLQHDGPDSAGVLVRSCERILAAIAGPRVALQISCEQGMGKLALGGEAMTQVLINLVANASQAMPLGGRIVITVRSVPGSKSSAFITVQDTGMGIPVQALGQIFHAGYSSKRTQRMWPAQIHHGLGLTIVRALVEGAGGTVSVTSALKKGTTFELKLPCSRL